MVRSALEAVSRVRGTKWTVRKGTVRGFPAKFMMIKRPSPGEAAMTSFAWPRRPVAATPDKLDYDFTLARDDVKDRDDY